MKAIKITTILGISLLVVLGVFPLTSFISCSKKEPAKEEVKQEIDYWTCGMHPEVRSPKPGSCPICGMELIPVYKKAASSPDTASQAPRMVQLTTSQMRLAGVATVAATRIQLNRSIKTSGSVEFDERSLATVSARFGGRIERLYVSFEGAVVSSGSPLADIYSPELAAAQREYLSALKSLSALPAQSSEQLVADARALVDASKERLRLWGITDAQIRELERSGSVSYTMTVVSPQSGTVTMRHVKEGDYVMSGEPMFEIANPNRVWIQAVVYEQDISQVKPGQHAVFFLPSDPSRTYEARVTFIAPVLDPETRSVKVRLEPGSTSSAVKPGMYVDAEIHVPGGRELAVPRDAVIDTGDDFLVYVEQGDGLFVARKVQIGPEADGFYPVLAGLREAEKVVARGAFLVDSETKITGGASALYGGASEVKSAKSAPSEHHH